MRWLLRLVKWIGVLFVVALVGVLGIRVWQVERGPPLAVWHTFSPDDLKAKDLAKLEWADYLKAEHALFAEVRTNVTDKLEPEDRVGANRYDGSPIYPGKFATDWNRSYLLAPAGEPVGAVVLLHGLTDSPYSLRHIARRYREHGFVAVAIRRPAHHLGAIAARGEVGALIVTLDSLIRMSSNPFFPCMLERIAEGIPRRAAGARETAAAAPGPK